MLKHRGSLHRHQNPLVDYEHLHADPRAVARAGLLEATVIPDTLILFGSRGPDDHHPDSGTDLVLLRVSDAEENKKRPVTIISRRATPNRKITKGE